MEDAYTYIEEWQRNKNYNWRLYWEQKLVGRSRLEFMTQVKQNVYKRGYRETKDLIRGRNKWGATTDQSLDDDFVMMIFLFNFKSKKRRDRGVKKKNRENKLWTTNLQYQTGWCFCYNNSDYNPYKINWLTVQEVVSNGELLRLR